MNALICVKREFEFDSPRVLLSTKEQWRCLTEEDEERDADVPETTKKTRINGCTLEEAHDACDNACHRIMVVTPKNIQSLPPISYSADCTEKDDDSCTTVY